MEPAPKAYRLKKNHCNYRKGNIVTWDEYSGSYSAHHYSQFKKSCWWSFSQWYIDKHPEIFEPYNI